MIDQLTSADFAPYLHQTFNVRIETLADAIPLELAAATDLQSLGRDSSPRQQPFSLLFLGPVSRQYLLQRIYRLEHDQLGGLDLFLVPLGPEGGRMRYEAVFN